MKEIIKKYLLPVDKFMSELHLRQPGFIYGICGSLTNLRKMIQKLKEASDLN